MGLDARCLQVVKLVDLLDESVKRALEDLKARRLGTDPPSCCCTWLCTEGENAPPISAEEEIELTRSAEKIG